MDVLTKKPGELWDGLFLRCATVTDRGMTLERHRLQLAEERDKKRSLVTCHIQCRDLE